MKPVSSWGRLCQAPHRVVMLTAPDMVAERLQKTGPGIAHGYGRSYGDVCLNPEATLWQTTALDHFIHFDVDTGLLRCEAGVSLGEIQRVMIPQGWMLPVTPGTQWVTVGGAIANDVHGKNHHVAGTFAHHVQALTLLRSDGEVKQCGPGEKADWFAATVGGLGLTGLITEATLQLQAVKGPWLETETLPFGNLSEFFTLAETSESTWTYTVAWVDCFGKKRGRGIFMRANRANCAFGPRAPHQKSVLLTPPFSLIQPLSVRAFNTLYYHYHRARAGRQCSHYIPFFYPLDHIQNWHRLYGPKGFYQYQCVVPRESGLDAITDMLDRIAAADQGSPLVVLKTFGNKPSPGMLSFPMPGVTFALDFPNRGEKTERLLQQLDAIVTKAGGRLYPAKDARMPRAMFEVGYPQLTAFKAYRDGGMTSAMSKRLMGD